MAKKKHITVKILDSTPADKYVADNRIVFEVVTPKISFDDFWKIAKNKYNLNRDLKEIIKKHFEARGFMKSQEWELGLKDFGIKE